MKGKLLVTVALPALLAAAALPALAQDKPLPSATPAPSVTVKPGGYSASQTMDQWRSSKVVGLNVYNGRNEKIGDINELIIDQSGKVVAAIIGVGGFLGIGEKNVAVPYGDLKFTRKDDGSISVAHDSTKETLQNAPNYTYYMHNRS